MENEQFLRTIYVGDRLCKSLLIDGEKEEVRIQVDCISRIRGETWNYYSDEDIYNGSIVFEGATNISLDPAGFIPNDTINEIQIVRPTIKKDRSLFVLSIDSVSANGERREIMIRIHASALGLVDPRDPTRLIRT